MFGARKIDQVTMARLRALSRQRTPAWAQAEREKIEAGYVAESRIRKVEALRRIPGLVEARRRLGSGK